MLRPTLVLIAVLAAPALVAPGRAQDSRAEERAAMIEIIEEHARYAPDAVEGGKIDPAVLQAMRTVPRHEFVPEEVRAEPTRTGRCRSATARRFRSPSSSR